MSSNLTIRPETPGDVATIFKLTEQAFRGQTYADGTEPLINDRLREAGALTLSLVADARGLIVGHIAFSKVEIEGAFDGFYALGPLSVMPERHKRGIGTKLVEAGLQQLRDAHEARGVILLGDPAYYARFGFVSDERLTYHGEPSAYLQCLVLSGEMPSGEVAFHPAFEAGA